MTVSLVLHGLPNMPGEKALWGNLPCFQEAALNKEAGMEHFPTAEMITTIPTMHVESTDFRV